MFCSLGTPKAFARSKYLGLLSPLGQLFESVSVLFKLQLFTLNTSRMRHYARQYNPQTEEADQAKVQRKSKGSVKLQNKFGRKGQLDRSERDVTVHFDFNELANDGFFAPRGRDMHQKQFQIVIELVLQSGDTLLVPSPSFLVLGRQAEKRFRLEAEFKKKKLASSASSSATKDKEERAERAASSLKSRSASDLNRRMSIEEKSQGSTRKFGGDMMWMQNQVSSTHKTSKSAVKSEFPSVSNSAVTEHTGPPAGWETQQQTSRRHLEFENSSSDEGSSEKPFVPSGKDRSSANGTPTNTSCRCVNSRCSQKYCGCHRNGRKCSPRCDCVNCENVDNADASLSSSSSSLSKNNSVCPSVASSDSSMSSPPDTPASGRRSSLDSPTDPVRTTAPHGDSPPAFSGLPGAGPTGLAGFSGLPGQAPVLPHAAPSLSVLRRSPFEDELETAHATGSFLGLDDDHHFSTLFPPLSPKSHNRLDSGGSVSSIFSSQLPQMKLPVDGFPSAAVTPSPNEPAGPVRWPSSNSPIKLEGLDDGASLTCQETLMDTSSLEAAGPVMKDDPVPLASARRSAFDAPHLPLISPVKDPSTNFFPDPHRTSPLNHLTHPANPLNLHSKFPPNHLPDPYHPNHFVPQHTEGGLIRSDMLLFPNQLMQLLPRSQSDNVYQHYFDSQQPIPQAFPHSNSAIDHNQFQDKALTGAETPTGPYPHTTTSSHPHTPHGPQAGLWPPPPSSGHPRTPLNLNADTQAASFLPMSRVKSCPMEESPGSKRNVEHLTFGGSHTAEDPLFSSPKRSKSFRDIPNGDTGLSSRATVSEVDKYLNHEEDDRLDSPMRDYSSSSAKRRHISRFKFIKSPPPQNAPSPGDSVNLFPSSLNVVLKSCFETLKKELSSFHGAEQTTFICLGWCRVVPSLKGGIQSVKFVLVNQPNKPEMTVSTRNGGDFIRVPINIEFYKTLKRCYEKGEKSVAAQVILSSHDGPTYTAPFTYVICS
eukprot:g11678.t1